jgi:hypothetical protein
MNDGMKIILERLKTHPEEFTDDSNPFASEGKWTKLIHKYQHNLPKEDVDAFKQAIDEIRQQEFTAKVMEELLDPKLEEQLTLNPYPSKANSTVLGGATQNGYTVTVNNGEAVVQLEPLINKKPVLKTKTLFGRLFNYS